MSPELEDLFARVIANRLERVANPLAAEPMEEPPAPEPTGQQLRAEGEAKALEAQPVWLEQAEAAMRQLAGTGRPFTAEDLVDIVGLPGTGMHRSNAVGALFSRWSQAHMIHQVGTTKSKRKSSHATTLKVWAGFRSEQSLGYKQGTFV